MREGEREKGERGEGGGSGGREREGRERGEGGREWREREKGERVRERGIGKGKFTHVMVFNYDAHLPVLALLRTSHAPLHSVAPHFLCSTGGNEIANPAKMSTSAFSGAS